MRLKADLRVLIDGEETTRVTEAIPAGATSFMVENTANFQINQFIIVGMLGSEDAELHRIIGLTPNTINTTSSFTFPHAQDVTVTAVAYNALFFYYSSTLTGTLSSLNVLPQVITPQGTYNIYEDVVNTSGFGWFRFYNSYTNVQSDISNAIPYAGFAENSVKAVFDRFLTQISNREKKIITDDDMFGWLNEAYTKATNGLNLGNREYTVPTPYSITVTGGTAEYDLPTGFNKVRMVTNNRGEIVNSINFEEAATYSNNNTQNPTAKYYIRGSKIGFTPTPGTTTTYYLVYTKLGTTLTSYNDLVDLPNNNFYFLVDFMLYRATPIIGGDAKGRLEAFNAGMSEMIVTSHKRDGDPDSIGIAQNAVV